jgi:hypothetical protein
MSEEFFETEILPDETSFGDEVPEELRPRTKIYLISPLDVTGIFPKGWSVFWPPGSRTSMAWPLSSSA